MKNLLLGMAPPPFGRPLVAGVAVADERLPGMGTIVLDAANGEYRIMNGHWEGVQWSPVRPASGR